MNVDYGNNILKYYTKGNDGYDVQGIMLGGQFIPKDLINKMYEMVRTPYKKGKCMPKIDDQEYYYEVFYGDYDNFLSNIPEEFHEDISIGGNGKNYHLDYYDRICDDIHDIRIGDYVVIENNHLKVYTEKHFKNKYIFK